MNGAKTKFYAYISLAIVIVGAFLYYGIGYFVGEIETLSATIVDQKKNVTVSEEKNAQLGNLRKTYGEVDGKMEQVKTAIVDKDKAVDFITAAERAARDNRVKMKMNAIDTKSAGKQNAAGPFTSTDFNFSVAGKFDDLMHYLYALENFRYETDISGLKVVRGDYDENVKDTIIMSFNLKLYQKNSAK